MATDWLKRFLDPNQSQDAFLICSDVPIEGFATHEQSDKWKRNHAFELSEILGK